MLYVNFNAYANYVTDSLYQWDINQDLVINGLGLSVAPEIHFANTDMDRAIVKQSTLESGVVTVRIPNSLLQAPLTIKAYVGVYESETFKVIEIVEIPVIAKTKPHDYVIEDSDEEIYSFKALENKIEKVLSDFDKNSENVIRRAEEAAERAEKAAENSGSNNPTITKESIENVLTGDIDTHTHDRYLPKSGGTMTGTLKAQNNTAYTTPQVRNIILVAEGDSIPTTGNGDVILTYTP
jgi:hypothetical protein